LNINQLILGSGSKWREGVLREAGIVARCIKPNLDESLITGENPADLALQRSIAKAKRVFTDLASEGASSVIIGCDQVLEFEGAAYGKAETREIAYDRLNLFAGKTHYLHSAFAIISGGVAVAQEVVTATMIMKPLNSQDIDIYLNTGEWQGCAGCYQYENKGGFLFEKAIGDESTIIGLPIKELSACLRDLGFLN
tara:strand:+ start:597 stop:1184 length:588 start_codon:yes stop_codon:yes gene_type:complete